MISIGDWKFFTGFDWTPNRRPSKVRYVLWPTRPLVVNDFSYWISRLKKKWHFFDWFGPSISQYKRSEPLIHRTFPNSTREPSKPTKFHIKLIILLLWQPFNLSRWSQIGWNMSHWSALHWPSTTIVLLWYTQHSSQPANPTVCHRSISPKINFHTTLN
jgi:hypothetical protein